MELDLPSWMTVAAGTVGIAILGWFIGRISEDAWETHFSKKRRHNDAGDPIIPSAGQSFVSYTELESHCSRQYSGLSEQFSHINAKLSGVGENIQEAKDGILALADRVQDYHDNTVRQMSETNARVSILWDRILEKT